MKIYYRSRFVMWLLKSFIVAFLFFPPTFLLGETPLSDTAVKELIVDKKSDEKKEAAVKDQKKDTPSPIEDEESRPASDDVQAATESYETAFVKTIIVLVGLLVLVVLTICMFKKISHGRLRSFNYLKSIKIIEKRPLSPKSMLYLIEVSGKQVLIAESQLEVRTLASLDWLGNEKDL